MLRIYLSEHALAHQLRHGHAELVSACRYLGAFAIAERDLELARPPDSIAVRAHLFPFLRSFKSQLTLTRHILRGREILPSQLPCPPRRSRSTDRGRPLTEIVRGWSSLLASSFSVPKNRGCSGTRSSPYGIRHTSSGWKTTDAVTPGCRVLCRCGR